ncbi:protein LURP-one-related 11-like [Magnolia sinica]|uniref:protein LURP-one-related 11-like n=1 Tax=Magnolia sinica TaxID=86752 RepID=UPI00265A5EA7|nr:protein LURP-one-related 11-like [Magnolia sinica]
MRPISSFLMAKICPSSSGTSAFGASNNTTSSREIFTVWMKSLIFNGNGCTVFDSNGQIIYRIDNYNRKCSDGVFLMDLRGTVLLTMVRKKLRVFGRWEGYKSNGSKLEEGKPWFVVRKPCRIMKGDSFYEVTVRWATDQSNCYMIKGSTVRSGCKIVDKVGRIVAEVKQKLSTSGVVLGDDVLSLVVEPNMDHSLIMGLVVVYGLVSQSM